VDVRPGRLGGVLVLEPVPLRDERGFFVRTLDADVLAGAGIDLSALVQENQSRSGHAVLRGMHLRAGGGEAKIVRCSRGAVFDVVVDVRPASPTFGQWESFVLDDEQHRQVYVPRGFAHGFQVLSADADVCYRHDARYVPGEDVAIAWDDPDIGVPWPLPPEALSPRDAAAPRLGAVRQDLERWGRRGPVPG
jgi:dTDP-4-dehydrorhamnose 3,5-epimerase